jgi:hypothetical protein
MCGRLLRLFDRYKCLHGVRSGEVHLGFWSDGICELRRLRNWPVLGRCWGDWMHELCGRPLRNDSRGNKLDNLHRMRRGSVQCDYGHNSVHKLQHGALLVGYGEPLVE